MCVPLSVMRMHWDVSDIDGDREYFRLGGKQSAAASTLVLTTERALRRLLDGAQLVLNYGSVFQWAALCGC